MWSRILLQQAVETGDAEGGRSVGKSGRLSLRNGAERPDGEEPAGVRGWLLCRAQALAPRRAGRDKAVGVYL